MTVRSGSYRPPLLGASLLFVEGRIQDEDNVVHVIAQKLLDRTDLLSGLRIGSRDFH